MNTPAQCGAIKPPKTDIYSEVLIDDLDIRVINHDTGELLRHLTLNPEHDYQPRNKP